MTATIQGKSVAGVAVGGDAFVPDTGWIPLDLPEGMTGQVFFKDNGDETAGISGILSASISKNADSPTLVLSPPDGYKFADTKWGSGSYGESLIAFSEFGAQNAGIGEALFASIKNGKLYFYNPNTSGNIMTVLFTESAGYKDAVLANPLAIGISYV